MNTFDDTHRSIAALKSVVPLYTSLQEVFHNCVQI